MRNKLVLSALSALFLAALTPQKLEAQFQPHYRYNYPTYYHQVKSVGSQGKMIEIEDDSAWQIEGYFKREVANWYSGDMIVISPGIKKDEFYITNVARNKYVPATLTLGPKLNNPQTCEIANVDHYSGCLEVRNSQGQVVRWLIDPNDRSELYRWSPGQKVIFGANDGWWSSWFSNYNSIIIGVENYPNYVKAKLY